MVNHISRYQNANQINQAAMQAAAAKQAQSIETADAAKQNVTQRSETNSDAVSTRLSDKARRLNEALAFSKQVPSEEALFNTSKVTELKSMVDKGDIKELLARYNTDDLASSLLNSPTAAFLR